jgi:hypothetical protein
MTNQLPFHPNDKPTEPVAAGHNLPLPRDALSAGLSLS